MFSIDDIEISHKGMSNLCTDYSPLPAIGLGIAKTEVTRVMKEARYANFMMKGKRGRPAKSCSMGPKAFSEKAFIHRYG